MFHFIYETTCLITGKFYRGMHSTENLEDGYLGSGVVIRRSIKKYGKDAHVRKILEFLSSREALSFRESEIITLEILANPLCMNLGIGGVGHHPGYISTEESRRKNSIAAKKMWKRLKIAGYVHPKQTNKVVANRVAKITGQKRTAEQKKRLQEAQREFQQRIAYNVDYKKAMVEKNRESHSKIWTIECENGTNFSVKNLKAFCLENSLPMSRMYKTLLNRKFVDGFRVMEVNT